MTTQELVELVDEEETAALPVEGDTAAARYASLKRRYDECLAALELSYQQRQAGTLTRAGFVTMLMLEDRAALAAPRLAHFERAMRAEEAAWRMTEAQQHHDALVPQVVEVGTQVVLAIDQLYQSVHGLLALLTEQELPIMALSDPQGQPAFVARQDSRSAVLSFLGRLDHTGGLATLLLTPTSHRPTRGETAEALDAISGAKMFPPRLAQRYIDSFSTEGKDL